MALFNFKKLVPSEFARLPRSLDDLEFWKATEFREFILYTRVIPLKSNLKKEQYNHFLLYLYLYEYYIQKKYVLNIII